MLMRCVKCRKKTKTIKMYGYISKNKHRMARGICPHCGIRKQQFINKITYEEIMGKQPEENSKTTDSLEKNK